jgi:hypothetical protein
MLSLGSYYVITMFLLCSYYVITSYLLPMFLLRSCYVCSCYILSVFVLCSLPCSHTVFPMFVWCSYHIITTCLLCSYYVRTVCLRCSYYVIIMLLPCMYVLTVFLLSYYSVLTYLLYFNTFITCSYYVSSACIYIIYFPNVFLRMCFLCFWIGCLVPALFPLCCYCVSSRSDPAIFWQFCSAMFPQCMLVMFVRRMFHLCMYVPARFKYFPTMFVPCSNNVPNMLLPPSYYVRYECSYQVCKRLPACYFECFQIKITSSPIVLLYYINSRRTYVLPTMLGSYNISSRYIYICIYIYVYIPPFFSFYPSAAIGSTMFPLCAHQPKSTIFLLTMLLPTYLLTYLLRSC